CEVTAKSIAAKQPSTPWVVFQWGSFSTARFTAYVSSVDATYSLFSTTGVPIRATCQVRLHEIPSRTKGQNPTSGALTAQRVHRVVAGDTLQSLAWREYGDANAWRAIAEANGIDDPSGLRTGTQVVLPAAEELGGH
ncbi:peptidase M23B, partial [Streptomyces sp. NRRL S-444]